MAELILISQEMDAQAGLISFFTDSENFIKVSQNPNKVARDTQGLPTVPHNDFGFWGLNFKDLASN